MKQRQLKHCTIVNNILCAASTYLALVTVHKLQVVLCVIDLCLVLLLPNSWKRGRICRKLALGLLLSRCWCTGAGSHLLHWFLAVHCATGSYYSRLRLEDLRHWCLENLLFVTRLLFKSSSSIIYAVRNQHVWTTNTRFTGYITIVRRPAKC